MDELIALSKYFYSLQQSGYCDIEDVYRLVIFDYIKSIKTSLLPSEELAIINKALQCLYTSCYIEDIACCGEAIPLDYENTPSEELTPIEINTIHTRLDLLDDSVEQLNETKANIKDIPDISGKVDRDEMTAALRLKANTTDVYTKSEVNDYLNNKADKVSVIEVEGTTVTQELLPNTFYKFSEVDSLIITLGTPLSNQLSIYACDFTAATDNTTLTLPATIIGEAPTIAAGHHYELNIMDNVLLYTETDGND